MGRPSKWNGPTESVRLPAHAIEQCLKLAQMLDQANEGGFVQNLEPALVTVDDEKFLIQPEPLTQADLEQVDELYQQLMSEMKARGMTRHQDLCVVFSELVKAWGTKL